MGLFDFVLKSSKTKAVETTRWVIEAYKAVQEENSQLTHLEIMEYVNAARCCGYKDSSYSDRLKDWLKTDDCGRGLYLYVYYIIQCESHRSELPQEIGVTVLDELYNAGFDESIIRFD